MQSPLPRRPRLREPGAPLGARHFLGEEGGRRQPLTAGLPDECIAGRGPGIPSNAARPQGCPQWVGPASTKISAVSGLAGAPRTGSLTLATAAPSPPAGRMGRGIPARPRAILGQTCLGRIKRLLADAGRARHGPPGLRRRGPMAQARAHRPPRRFPCPGRPGATRAAMGDAGIDWIAAPAAHARGVPARGAHRRGPLHLPAPFRDSIEGMRGLRSSGPGKDGDAYGHFAGSPPQAMRVSGAFRGK
jgi:hypothetical protein